MAKKTTVSRKSVSKRKTPKKKTSKRAAPKSKAPAIIIGAVVVVAVAVVAIVAFSGGSGGFSGFSAGGETLTEGVWTIGKVNKNGTTRFKFPIKEGNEYWVFVSGADDRIYGGYPKAADVQYRAHDSEGSYRIGNDLGFPITDWYFKSQATFNAYEDSMVTVEVKGISSGPFAITYTIGYNKPSYTW